MKTNTTITALLGLLLGLLASGTAAADAAQAGSAEAQLGVSAVVLSRCQIANTASVSVDCRRNVPWTVAITTVDAADLVADQATPATRIVVKQVYF